MSEPLLKLAQALGYKTESERLNGVELIKIDDVRAKHYFSKSGVYNWTKFDPLNNAEQCLEIMEHFKICIDHLDGLIFARTEKDTEWTRGKTIQSAVLACALEIIKPPIER